MTLQTHGRGGNLAVNWNPRNSDKVAIQGAKQGDSRNFGTKLEIVPAKNGVSPGTYPDARITFLDMLGSSLDRDEDLLFWETRIIVDSVGRF